MSGLHKIFFFSLIKYDTINISSEIVNKKKQICIINDLPVVGGKARGAVVARKVNLLKTKLVQLRIIYKAS